MNRLTKRDPHGNVYFPKCFEVCHRFPDFVACVGCSEEVHRAERLAYYEDLEESGRLVVLPCKVGDVLWTYANYPCEYIYPFEVRGIRPIEKEITTDKVGTVKWDDIGRTVFLTREAAEAAMKEVTR